MSRLDTLDLPGDLYRLRSIGSNTAVEAVGPIRDTLGHPLRVKEVQPQERGLLTRLVLWRERNRAREVSEASMADLWALIDEAQTLALGSAR